MRILLLTIANTSYRRDEYKGGGPLRSTQYYKSAELDQQHGLTVNYLKDGRAESFGPYRNGKKHGEWY